MIHPELSLVLPYQSGANDLIEGPFLGGYMEIRAPNESATMSGRACGRLVNPALADDDRHRAFYYTLMPNLMLSIHPDYVNYYLLTPVAANLTRVESEWMLIPRMNATLRSIRRMPSHSGTLPIAKTGTSASAANSVFPRDVT